MMKKVKIQLLKYVGGKRKITDKFEMEVLASLPEIKKQVKIKKIADRSLIKFIKSFKKENQLHISDPEVKKCLLSTAWNTMFITIKEIKVKKKVDKDSLIQIVTRKEVIFAENETNFIKFLKYLTSKFKQKFGIDTWTQSWVKWESIKDEYVTFFIYCENDKLKLRKFKIVETVSDEVIYEAFESGIFTDKELRKLFIKILRENIRGT